MIRCLPLLTLLLAACATQPPQRAVEPSEEAQALALRREGDFAAAATIYQQLAARDPRQRVAYSLLAAEAWRDEGLLGRAADALAGLGAAALDETEAAHVDLLLAEAVLEDADAETALILLARDADSYPPHLLLRFHELRARALETASEPFEAARERARLDALLGETEREYNRMAIRSLLRQLPVPTLLERREGLVRDDPLLPLLDDLLERAGLAGRRPDTWTPFDPDDQGYRPLRRVALLLPATGPLSAAAQAIRDGFMTAYFADDRERPEVRVYDAGALPEDAVLAYRRAIADGAERVVGPLSRESVARLLADGMPPVPLLALNHAGADIAPWGSYEFGLLPDQDGRFLAERLLEGGVRQVALVVVEEDFAARAATAFRVRFEAGGGRLLGEVQVAPGQTDYSDVLARALDVGLAERRRRTLQSALATQLVGEAVYRPDLEAAVLFARSGFARLLVPQIRVFTAGELPLLASSHVFSGDLQPSADRDLDELSFCDLAWLVGADTPLPPREALGSLPTLAGGNARLFAFGMDAYRLLGHLDWLAEDPNRRIDAASGELSIAPGGQVQRHLVCARFVNGVPQPLPDSREGR